MKTSLKQRLLALLMSALLLVSFCGAAALAEAENPSPGVGDEDCTHPEELREEAVKVVDYLYKPIEDDAAQHMTTEIEEVTVVCGECYAPLEEAFTRQGKSYAEDHEAGEDTTSEMVRYEYAPIEGDTAMHEVTEIFSVSDVCAKCGAAMGEAVEEDGKVYPAAHNYKAAGDDAYVCADCGFACPHTDAEPQEKEIRDWYDFNEDTHTHVKLMVTYDVCPICDGVINYTTGEVAGEPEAHELDAYGRCGVCEYAAPADHEHVLPNPDDPDSWHEREYDIYLDAENHLHYTESAYYPDCTICGEQIDEPQIKTDSETVQHAYNEDGVCACGWHEDGGLGGADDECRHENIQVSTDRYPVYLSCVAVDDQEHLAEGVQTEIYLSCPDCGYYYYYYVYDPDYTLKEAHWFEDMGGGKLVCSSCGYEKICAHAHKVLTYSEINAVTEPVDTGRGTHVALYGGWIEYWCYDCRSYLYEEYNMEKIEQPHVDRDGDGYGDGYCDECGAKDETCRHEHVTQIGEVVYSKYIDPVDAAQHEIIIGYDAVVRCDDCGEEIIDIQNEYVDYRVEVTCELHTYDKDKLCTVCGYKTDCVHENAEVERSEPKTYYEFVDDGTHNKITETTLVITCNDCGVTLPEYTERVVEEGTHTYEEDENGWYICRDCGHDCGHSGATTEVTFKPTDYDDAAATDSTHTAIGETITTITCPHCGMQVEQVEPDTQEAPHTYEFDEDGNAVCADCGYTCTHASSTVREVFVVDAYTSNGASGHTVKGDTHLVERCDGCGAVLTDVVRTEGVSYDEPHTLRDGKCALCGYVKPVKKSSEPAAAITFVEVDALHGAIVAEAPRMAVALVNVANALETENGEALDLAVEGLDELLAAEEIEALKALPAAEQMLVTLNALGYADEADFAIAELQLTLSPEALALIDAIEARVAALTEDERAAYDAQLAKLFPIVQDAEGVNRTELTLEVRLDGEAGYRLEKYTFAQQADMTWALDAIAFAEVQG